MTNHLPARAVEIESKIWGTSKVIYRDDRSEIVEITVKAGGFCSRHYHKNKDNLFLVTSGALRVDQFGFRGQSKWLYACGGGSGPLLVPAGVTHQFTAETDVVAWEVYRAIGGRVIDPADIVRLSEGGIRRLMK